MLDWFNITLIALVLGIVALIVFAVRSRSESENAM